MSSYTVKKLICGCCENHFESKVVRGYLEGKNTGLDTNPNTPAVFDEFITCPKCGYASRHIQKAAGEDIKKIVKKNEYNDYIHCNGFDEKLNTIIKSAWFSEYDKQYCEAGYDYLVAAWYMENSDSDATNERTKAVECYSKYLEDSRDIDAAIILIDCLRRLQRFYESEETAISLLQHIQTNNYRKIVELELKLIRSQNSASHLLSEVE